MNPIHVKMTINNKGLGTIRTFYLTNGRQRVSESSDAGAFSTVTKAMNVFLKFLDDFNAYWKGNCVVTYVEVYTVESKTTTL
jgi:hypothetical protein